MWFVGRSCKVHDRRYPTLLPYYEFVISGIKLLARLCRSQEQRGHLGPMYPRNSWLTLGMNVRAAARMIVIFFPLFSGLDVRRSREEVLYVYIFYIHVGR